MAFADQSQAKKFFIERIISQARNENINLSEAEKYMLGWTEVEPNFKIDDALTAEFYKETTDKEYEKKITHLIRNAYKTDISITNQNKELYEEAYDVLNKGDHYILVMITEALYGGLPNDDFEAVPEANPIKDRLLLILAATAIGVTLFGSLILMEIFGFTNELKELSHFYVIILIATAVSAGFIKKASSLTLSQLCFRSILYFLSSIALIYYIDQNLYKNLSIFHPISEEERDLQIFIIGIYCLGLVAILLDKKFIGFLKVTIKSLKRS